MAIQTVFSNNLDPIAGSLTARFINATGFYIKAPLVEFELEIDVFLQVYIPTASGEDVRSLSLGNLQDGLIRLNETDTQSIKAIPYEFVDSGLEMALYFTPSTTTFLEVYAVGLECTLCQVQGGIFAIEEEISDRFDSLNSRIAGIESVLAQILNLVSVDVITPGNANAKANGVFTPVEPKENVLIAYHRGFL